MHLLTVPSSIISHFYTTINTLSSINNLQCTALGTASKKSGMPVLLREIGVTETGKSLRFLAPLPSNHPIPSPCAARWSFLHTKLSDTIKPIIQKITTEFEKTSDAVKRQGCNFNKHTEETSDTTDSSTAPRTNNRTSIIDNCVSVCNLTLDGAIGQRVTALIEHQLQQYQDEPLWQRQNRATQWKKAAKNFFKACKINIDASTGPLRMQVDTTFRKFSEKERANLYFACISSKEKDKLWYKACENIKENVSEHREQAIKAYQKSMEKRLCDFLTEQVYDNLRQQTDYAESVSDNPGTIEEVWQRRLSALQTSMDNVASN